MSGEETPIGDRHIAFAQAVMALCREHGANDITVKFSLTGGKLWPPGEDTGWSDAAVTFDWAEGRHGASQRARLRAESYVSIKETPQ